MKKFLLGLILCCCVAPALAPLPAHAQIVAEQQHYRHHRHHHRHHRPYRRH